MEQTPAVHYRIEVYAPGTRPPEPSQSVPLCPELRGSPVPLAIEVAQVTCRRCLQLLDVIGLRPIQ